MSVRVAVDPQVCALHGYCERIAPAVFELRDGDTAAHVRQEVVQGAELAELVDEAEASCPTRAIRLSPG